MKEILGLFLGLFMIAVMFGALEVVIFMLLWNWIVPMFWVSAPELSFWNAWGLLILVNLILIIIKR